MEIYSDMHIHVKNGVKDLEILKQYVECGINHGINEFLLLDHGYRISPKHAAVLDSNETVKIFKDNVVKISKMYTELKFWVGIEIDYSSDIEFRKKTLELLRESDFDKIIGSIHSWKLSSQEYFKAIIDMLLNYPINIIGHIQLNEEYKKYSNILIDIFELCAQKGVAIEINTSDRSLWNKEQLNYILDLADRYKVGFTIGSDAHQPNEVGYNFPYVHQIIKERLVR